MKVHSPDREIISENGEFEQQYLALRKIEGRLYTDEEVQQLPEVIEDHPLKREWEMRRFSGNKLVEYLSRKKNTLQVLEVGCGNGWLSNSLSLVENSFVRGIDINRTELAQAKRVFAKANLVFEWQDLREADTSEKFDVIVFAASLQYFSSLSEILNAALQRLCAGGEIHILDTHFYDEADLQKASERSRIYFEKIGFAPMSKFYFHHSLAELKNYNCKMLYNPWSWQSRLLKRSPFPWICIVKS